MHRWLSPKPISTEFVPGKLSSSPFGTLSTPTRMPCFSETIVVLSSVLGSQARKSFDSCTSFGCFDRACGAWAQGRNLFSSFHLMSPLQYIQAWSHFPGIFPESCFYIPHTSVLSIRSMGPVNLDIRYFQLFVGFFKNDSLLSKEKN